MKRTIEIECPEGCRPVYNAKTSNVEMVPENIIGRIQTHEDARTYLGYAFKNAISYNKSVNSLAKLQTILNALNEKHEFDLLTGTVWYPWVNFFKMESVPKNATVIAHFRYQDKKFALVSANATSGGTCGLGAFLSINGIGAANANVGMFACKSEEIAKYVSTQFGKLIFEACFTRYFKNGEFEWLD